MGSTPISGTLRQFSFNTLIQVTAPNLTVRFVERRLRTPNAALEHHEAQRHLEVIHRHRDYLVKAIAANQIHQDQLLDRLTN